MYLNHKNLVSITSATVEKPTEKVLNLPEKVIQFGTGVLLRGLPDYFIDKANKKGVFNGRVVVVKSTSSGGVDAFKEQNNLYTTCIKGISKGEIVEENIINASISRVLSAREHWNEILATAASTDIEVIISNTTEAGIVESSDNIQDMPPASFPGKLLSYLYARYKAFNGDVTKGLIILPTELISNNGDVLKQYTISLAKKNNLEDTFIQWLTSANSFCNTLVDRIVPGAFVDESLGYKDDLMIMAEPFTLWAIETNDPKVKDILSFASVDTGVVVTPSVYKFKELKLRLLNGSHTLTCAYALLQGFVTVKEAMENVSFKTFIEELAFNEIGQAIESEEITRTDINDFAGSVIDRFSNPFLAHKWEAISLNYTSKMVLRNVPIVEKWYSKSEDTPKHIATGFAAYIILMDTEKSEGKFFTKLKGNSFAIQDDQAGKLYDYWQNEDTVVKNVLADQAIWGVDLTSFPGFLEEVQVQVNAIKKENKTTV